MWYLVRDPTAPPLEYFQFDQTGSDINPLRDEDCVLQMLSDVTVNITITN